MSKFIKTILLYIFIGIIGIALPGKLRAQVLVKGSSNFFIGYGYPGLQGDLKSLANVAGASGMGPISLAYQFAFTDKLAIGLLGEYAQATSVNVNWFDNVTGLTNTYNWNISMVTVTLKVDFHYLRSRKLDIYSGFAVGYGRASVTANGEENPAAAALTVNPWGYAVNLFGLRYMFVRHFGLYTEIGYGNISLVTGGISIILGNGRQWWQY